MLTAASADTKALWGDISDYAKWGQFPESTELTLSETHNNMFVISYVNDVVTKAVADGTVPLPDGAIIVKENYAKKDDPMPMALTVMSKMGKDWYWAQGTPDGQVFMGPDGPLEGKNVSMCVNCHGAATDNDSVLTHTFAGGGTAPAPMLTDASADTTALWGDISGYAKWGHFPESTELTQSKTHNNMFVISYINDVVAKAASDGTVPLPDGAIIVKENYAKKDDATPMALTVMSKMGQDWYWAQGTPDGKVFVGPDGPLEGKDVGMCVMCHGAATDNDSVLTHTF